MGFSPQNEGATTGCSAAVLATDGRTEEVEPALLARFELRLPAQLGRKILVYQFLIKRTQLGHIGLLMVLGVKIIWIKITHRMEQRLVLRIHEVLISTLTMSR